MQTLTTPATGTATTGKIVSIIMIEETKVHCAKCNRRIKLTRAVKIAGKNYGTTCAKKVSLEIAEENHKEFLAREAQERPVMEISEDSVTTLIIAKLIMDGFRINVIDSTGKVKETYGISEDELLWYQNEVKILKAQAAA
jgi:hypothetical protein